MLVAIIAADSITSVVYMRINILPVWNLTSKLSNSEVYLCASEVLMYRCKTDLALSDCSASLYVLIS